MNRFHPELMILGTELYECCSYFALGMKLEHNTGCTCQRSRHPLSRPSFCQGVGWCAAKAPVPVKLDQLFSVCAPVPKLYFLGPLKHLSKAPTRISRCWIVPVIATVLFGSRVFGNNVEHGLWCVVSMEPSTKSFGIGETSH